MSVLNDVNLVADTIERREYQVNIAEKAKRNNTLVVLPTGMGKTIVALLVICDQLQKQKSQILFLAPTKPLVTQHAEFLRSYLTLDDNEIVLFTGEIPPAKRQELWNKARIIVSTPQVIENDLLAKRCDLSQISFLIFDEVHRSVGNYAYVYVAQQYHKQRTNGLVLGMTASPGNDPEKIKEVCSHLKINHIEIRTKEDPDVKPYVHELSIQWKEVNLPDEYIAVVQILKTALHQRLKTLRKIGVIDTASVSLVNRRKLLEARQRIQAALRGQTHPSGTLYTAASTQNAAVKIYHAIELLQTQGSSVAEQYLQRLQQEATSKSGSRASKTLMKDTIITDAWAQIKTLSTIHPKIPAIAQLVTKQIEMNPASKIIVFTHFRDTSQLMVDILKQQPQVKPVRFIGQAGKGDDKGLSQKEQSTIIKDFRKGTFNVLVATSVAEEGLDIPQTDLVVFFEPVPSEIRTIQRRGRTGRKMPGKVVIYITKGTADEGYYWSARRKEKKMRSELEALRHSLRNAFSSLPSTPTTHQQTPRAQKTLEEYQKKNADVAITVDHRESRSTVARRLDQKGVLISTKQLDVGDYILSSRLGVERKSVDDFLSSLCDGKLFHQIKYLRDAYSRPLLLIEGEGLLTKRNINAHAIYGCLSSILVDYGIPIISTKDEAETAEVLYVMAKREQRSKEKSVSLRGEKHLHTLTTQQQYLIEGLPHISSVLATRLLRHFGTIYALMNASEKQLCEVQGIGPSIAKDIHQVLHSDFAES